VISEVPIISAITHLPYSHKARLEYGKFIAYANAPPCDLSFIHPEIGTYQVQGVDIFECLFKLRKILHEQHDVYLLCAGSRIDTYSSGAARNMSGGRIQFIYTFGEYPTRANQVQIFDSTTSDKVGSLEEQIRYHNDWLKSVDSL
jgi:hypothetical protein